MAVKFLENLSNNYLDLLNDKEDFNVIINAGEFPNIKIFQAHSNILRYRSLHFRNELAKTRKDNKNIKTINLNNISAEQFEIIIKYIYGGVILLKDHDEPFIFNLMLVAHELFLEEMTKFIEKHLIEEKTHWLRSQFTRIHQKSFQNNQFQNLQEWCNDYLVKYPNQIFDSSENFKSLQENALVSLIKRDDLQMEEVKIWITIIKWGIAQNPNLSSNGPEKWTNENFLALKNTLQNCLPHIRYFQISGDDIIDNVEPYHKILDKNLWDDIMKRAVNPNRPVSSIIHPPRRFSTTILLVRTTKLLSSIINEAQAAEIATWIDKKRSAYSIATNPYEFKLLLRGTRDGFSNEAFWNICDKQANTIVVVKVRDTDEIIGGYNPKIWDKNMDYFINCKNSFIFSLKNRTIPSSILSRVKKSKYAIYSSPRCGPCFGAYGDLEMINNFNQGDKCRCEYNQESAYEKPIRNINDTFSVSEYEILQVHKRTKST
ncbi:hypothetical protein C2G38_668508 [Gigaspora rosea]|uniref:TLD-domain-containing protein n=1 Tax=Gigaspora rosea TaxID=44941 RepID=A0A397VPM9_9GLOM|nr:hypothetical protein C2G38_668508 [Gigaspora rosea]